MANTQSVAIAQQLRRLRQEADLSQKDMAIRLGLSRESIVAIENAHPRAMNNLKLIVVSRWFNICRAAVKASTREHFIDQLKRFFKI